MSDPTNVVEYADDLIFAACEFRWEKGDKFALIEAVAICAANDREYPQWVRYQINAAMTEIFSAVFPDVSLVGGRKGLGISALPEGNELANMKESFSNSSDEAKKHLSLSHDRLGVVDTHIKAVRNYHLAELVERFAVFEINSTPPFSKTTNVMKELATMLRLSPPEWETQVAEDGFLGPINGLTMKYSAVEPVCRMATVNVLRSAWREYQEFFEEMKLNERAED
jgi:hypothetical protein